MHSIKIVLTLAICFLFPLASIGAEKDNFDELAFVSFNPAPPKDLVTFDLQNARRLVIGKDGRAFVTVKGELQKKNHKIKFKGKDVPLKDQKFEIVVFVDEKTQDLPLTVIDDKGKPIQLKMKARAAPLLAKAKKKEKEPQGPIPPEWKYKTSSTLTNLYATGVAVFQQSGGNSFSPGIVWAPHMQFSHTLGARILVGGMLLKKISSGMFLAGNYEILGTLDVLPIFSIELGGGAQTWFGYGGTRAVGSLYLTAHRNRNNLKFWNALSFIEGFYFAYTAFLDSNFAHQFRVGVNLAIF